MELNSLKIGFKLTVELCDKLLPQNSTQKNVMDILHNLAHDEDYCVIVVTHDMEIAKAADIVYKMKDGELI